MIHPSNHLLGRRLRCFALCVVLLLGSERLCGLRGAADDTTPAESQTAAAESTTTAPDRLPQCEYTLANGTATLTRYHWIDERTVIVPDTIEGCPVTAIGSYAFQYCYADSVTLPSSLRKIADAAFIGCAYLTELTVPEGCETIGDAAFEDCSLLQTVTIPRSVREIGDAAFARTPFLAAQTEPFVILGDGILYAYRGTDAAVVIPDGVRTVGYYAFADCQTITSVTIPQSVTRILDGAFDHCTALSEVTAPDTLAFLAADAFTQTAWYNGDAAPFCILGKMLVAYRGTDAVVNVPKGITVINDSAFEGNPAITTLNVPEGVRELRRAACYRCSSLQVVNLPDSLETIGSVAFYQCEVLAFCAVGDGLRTIGEQAFVSCGALTHLTLPASLESIGDQALGYAYSYETASVVPSAGIRLYSNAKAVMDYAKTASLPCEAVVEATHTEPAVTTILPASTTTAPTSLPPMRDWLPPVVVGAVLLLAACVLRLGRHRE